MWAGSVFLTTTSTTFFHLLLTLATAFLALWCFSQQIPRAFIP